MTVYKPVNLRCFWRFFTLLAIVGVVFSVSRTASADPKVIDVSSGFPSEDMPLGSAFALQIKVTKGSDVYAVFVEYADGIFGSNAGASLSSCAALPHPLVVDSARLAALTADEKNHHTILSADKLVASIGTITFSDIEGAPSSLHGRPAFLVGPGPKDANGGLVKDANSLVKLAIPSTRFFKHGARYCLLTFERVASSTTDNTVKDMIDQLDQQCRAGLAVGNGCQLDALSSSSLARLSVEERQKFQELGAPAAALLHTLATAESALKNQSHALGDGHLFAPSTASRDGKPWLGANGQDSDIWCGKVRPPLEPRKSEGGKPAVPLALVSSDPAGEFISILLARAGKLDFASTPIEGLRIVDGQVHGLLNDPAGDKDVVLAAAADIKLGQSLQASNTDASTLADLVEFGTGSSTGKLSTQIHDLKLTSSDAERVAVTTRLDDLAKRCGNIVAALPISNVDPKSCPGSGPGADPLNRAASKWLNGANAVSKECETLTQLQSALPRLFGAFDSSKAVLAKTVITYQGGIVIDATVGLNPQTWIFSYLTPGVGYIATSDAFGIPTVTLELTAFANSSDEPMWNNGFSKDIRRAFSLELGISPQTTSFGPNARYSGPGSLPPILLGTGLHLIPYVTLSTGLLFVNRKRSVLADETPSLHVLGYLGASVQTNVPDIILSLVQGKKTSGE